VPFDGKALPSFNGLSEPITYGFLFIK